MKIKLIIIISCFLSINLLCNEINTYDQILIKKIQIGSVAGKLGYDVHMAKMGADPGPTVFVIENNNLVYICDNINSKINVYDINLNFIREIDSTKEYSFRNLFEIKLDNKENIIVLDSMLNLIKINNNGDLLFKIQRNELSTDIISMNNFFPYGENIIYYDSKSKEKIKFYDSKGKKLDALESQIIISKANNIELTRSINLKLDINVHTKLKKLIESNKTLFDKIPLTTDFYAHREYFKTLEGFQFNSAGNSDNKQKTVNDIDLDLSCIGKGRRFIDFDQDNNSYWKCDVKGNITLKVIIILSPYGEILDAFYNNIKWSLVAVAPSGDVYFLSYDNKYVYFHKTDRAW